MGRCAGREQVNADPLDPHRPSPADWLHLHQPRNSERGTERMGRHFSGMGPQHEEEGAACTAMHAWAS